MRLIARFRRFAVANKGLAALEFALVAPMMITLLFGSVEVLNALSANRRAQNVAASLADVTSRDTGISDEELSGLWAAADVLMFPDAATTMDIRITSVSVVSATNATVEWSEGHNLLDPLGEGDAVTLPDGMMTPGSSVIMVDTVYHYKPPLRFLFPAAGVAMTHSAIRRSRLVDPIPREQGS